ncbi:hypothetical protein D3C81_2090710 [compost metagenome]
MQIGELANAGIAFLVMQDQRDLGHEAVPVIAIAYLTDDLIGIASLGGTGAGATEDQCGGGQTFQKRQHNNFLFVG